MNRIIIATLFAVCSLALLSSCNRNCFECSYKLSASKVKQEVCGDLPNEKKRMKSSMQMKADSIGAELICKGKN